VTAISNGIHLQPTNQPLRPDAASSDGQILLDSILLQRDRMRMIRTQQTEHRLIAVIVIKNKTGPLKQRQPKPNWSKSKL